MKVCIFGTGAVGSHFAVRLSAIGVDVSCIARGKQLEKICADGIMLHRADQTILHEKVRASDNPNVLGKQDFVIVTVKSYSLCNIVDDLKPLLGNDTPIIFAQNGIPWWYFYGLNDSFKEHRIKSLDPDGRLWNEIGVSRAIGGVVYSANTLTAPGVVLNTSRAVIGFKSVNQTDRCHLVLKVSTKSLVKPIWAHLVQISAILYGIN